jgi:hypothetical protein
MERGQDDADFDPGSRALRIALVEFLVEASLENPQRAELINAVLAALKEGPGKQAAATARLEQLAAHFEHQNRESVSRSTELGAKLESIVSALREVPRDSPAARSKKDLLEAARAAAQEVFRLQADAASADRAGDDARNTARKLDQLLADVGTLRMNLALREHAPQTDSRHEAPRSKQIVPTQWMPPAESPDTKSGPATPPDKAAIATASLSRWTLFPEVVPAWIALVAVAALMVSVVWNVALLKKVGSQVADSAGKTVVPMPSTPTARRNEADKDAPVREQFPGSTRIEPAAPRMRWRDHWQYALGQTARACKLRPGEEPSPDVLVRTCLCPSFSPSEACEPSAAWDETRLLVALQAALAAFDPQMLPGGIDGAFGRNTVGAAQRLAQRCNADASDLLAPSIRELENDLGIIKAQKQPQAPRAVAVKLRDHVWDALKQIERNYPDCNPPDLRGGG